MGLRGAQNQGFLSINVDQCVNTTKNENMCYSKNKIQTELKGASFIIRYLDFLIDNRNLLNPNIPYFKAESQNYISLNSRKDFI